MKTLTPYYFSFLFALSSTVGHAQVYIGNGNQTGESVPIEPYYAYTYSQSIYLAGEIGSSGDITGLTYFANSATDLANSNEWTVYIGHTSKSSFADTTDWVSVDDLTQVFSGAPTLTNREVTLTFPNPFTYNGTSNLIIAVHESSDGYDDDSHEFYATQTTAERSITYYVDGDATDNPDPSNPPFPSEDEGSGGVKLSVPNIILQGITSNKPSPPTDVVAIAGDKQATLTWTVPNNNGGSAITGYEYSLDGGSYQSFTPTIDGTTATATVTGLTNGTTYQIAIRAVSNTESGVSSAPVAVRPDILLFVGGDGTADNPYQIATADQLNQVRDYLDKHFILTANIDLNTSSYGTVSGWAPIGSGGGSSFTGTFNGKGYTIANLFIDRSSTDSVGLFGHTRRATIDSVGLTDVNVKGGDYVGGLVGFDDNSRIRSSYVTGTVSSDESGGGLVGESYGTSIANSYATASVSGTLWIGGLVGYGDKDTIANSYATGDVLGGGDRVGGLMGSSGSSVITFSYATGAVTGDKRVGGFIGDHSSEGTIANSYATGAVTGNERVGGFIGYDDGGSIANSYATGAVKGAEKNIGGFVGYSESSTITNSYATGKVEGDGTAKGGFTGKDDDNNSTFNNNYWDTQSSGVTQGVGSDVDQTDIKGKTSAEMTLPSTFIGWSFTSTWNITPNSTYPWLRDNAQTPPPAPCADTAQLDTVSCESYRWRAGGRDSTYTTSAKDTVRVTRVDGCDSVYILHLTITPFDTATVVSGDSITVADNGTATYRWLDCGDDKSPIEGAMARVFTPGQNGNYAVAIAIDSGGVTCRDTSSCIPFSVTGIVENSFAHALRVYPNPTEGAVTIDLGAWQASVELTLTDASGRQVATQTYTKAEKINYLLPQPPGVYLMTLTSADKRARIRLVKQ